MSDSADAKLFTAGDIAVFRKLSGAALPAAIFLLAVATIVAYVPAIASSGLLEEHSIVGWANHIVSSQSPKEAWRFLAFRGPDSHDAWGPAASLFVLVVGPALFHLPALYHLVGVVLHLLASAALLVFLKAFLDERVPRLSLAAAALFALYPLHAEAVSTLCGLPAVAACLCFLASLGRFLSTSVPKGDKQPAGVRASVPAALLYALAVLWDGHAVFWAPVFVLVALLAAEGANRRACLLPCLPMMAIALGGWLLGEGAGQHVSGHASSIEDGLVNALRNMAFPINQAVWHGYSSQYRFLYIFLSPFAALLPFALWRDGLIRRACLLAVFWLAAALLPCAQDAAQGTDLYGSRWLYMASAPFCLVLACALFALSGLTRHIRLVTNPVCATGVIVLIVFYFNHLFNQNAAYRVGGQVRNAILRSLARYYGLTGCPAVLARDIPPFVALAPPPALGGAPLFHCRSAQLGAPSPPAGRLKEGLRAGARVRQAVRWDRDFASLVPLDLSPPRQTYGKLSGRSLVDKLKPALPFLETVRFDETSQCLVLERGGQRGPAVSFRGEELSPVAGDFLYVDASIEAPAASPSFAELHWITVLKTDYDNKERKLTVPVTTDGEFHRYLFSLRTVGWTTNGPLTQITLGFPPGARVRIKGLGVLEAEGQMAELEAVPAAGGPAAAAREIYTGLYAPFAEDRSLGLCQIPDRSAVLRLRFRTAGIAGAASAIIEIARPDCQFNNPNGSALSDVTFKTLPVEGREGEVSLRAADFGRPGCYRLRLAAVDASGHIIGSFSDDIVALVDM